MSTFKTPFNGENTVTMTGPVVFPAAGTFIQIPSEDPGVSTYLDPHSTDGIPSIVTYRSAILKKISRHPKCNTLFRPRSRQGYMWNIKHEFIKREETTEGETYDEPVKISISGYATSGARMTSQDWIAACDRLKGYAFEYDLTTKVVKTTGQRFLDRLLRGITNMGENI